MSRLYVRIYLHFLAIIVVFGVVTAIGWLAHTHDNERGYRLDAMGHLVAQSLPEKDAELPAVLEELAQAFRVDLALYRFDRRLIASAGTPIPPPPDKGHDTSGWHRAAGGSVLHFRLPDGRWLAAHVPWRPRGRWITWLLVLAVVVAVGAYPLARQVTLRLERLQRRVDALGAGDLGARVDVEGWDEVAALARSFNRAAGQIESLVVAQRTMLASASHELRSPLARMRMAIELYGAAPRRELRERIERDIVELDNLIDELLLASRLQTVHDLESTEPIDLLAFTAEEGARVGAVVAGDSVGVNGDRRLLRHLVRNLFENARQHGGGSAIAASVRKDDDDVVLLVCDHGPGIPESAREHIFEPFYRAAARREAGAGVGLGLHLVRVIAERHGANARYRPNEPIGSCFEVRFPRNADSPALQRSTS